MADKITVAPLSGSVKHVVIDDPETLGIHKDNGDMRTNQDILSTVYLIQDGNKGLKCRDYSRIDRHMFFTMCN
jgi:hypothetical protein